MMGSFASLIMGLAGPLARRVFVSLGLSVVTFTGLTQALELALSSSVSKIDAMDPDLAAFVALSGAFEALGIIAGAVVLRVSLTQLTRIIPNSTGAGG